jgi:hypothetical protein
MEEDDEDKHETENKEERERLKWGEGWSVKYWSLKSI